MFKRELCGAGCDGVSSSSAAAPRASMKLTAGTFFFLGTAAGGVLMEALRLGAGSGVKAS